MREVDVFKDVIRNVIEGTMFHSQMIQYFDYLGLDGFAKLHKIRFERENAELVELFKYVVEVYGVAIGDVKPDSRNFIPEEWYEGLRESVRDEDRVNYIRFGVESWKDWESKSKSLYGQRYFELNDLRDAGGSEKIMDIVRGTEMELRFAYNLMCKLRNSGYDVGTITLLDNEVLGMYKKFYKKGEV